MTMRKVFYRQDDPYIYLYVNGEWYCYDPASKPIGRGAMGVVYKGYRVNDAHPVAIKRVFDNYAAIPRIRARARQEASLNLKHPNLVDMIGYCEYSESEGPIFILSELVKGVVIKSYLKNIPKEQRTNAVCKAVCEVLDALDYLHLHGVVHRDVKPSNIMVEDSSNVKLMDLGLSRMTGGNKFSKYGFIGTPQYAAPEQILGNDKGHEKVGTATDIYSLGVTFYELLSGFNPFDSGSEAETLRRQINDPLPKTCSIPPRLMKVISKATKKKQSARWRSANEFKAEIERAMKPRSSLLERIMGPKR